MEKPLVALVDDYPDILVLMAEVLDDAGYRTATGTSADDVERLTANECPDLLILDVRMPGERSGLPLLRAIRMNPATAKLPILVATADVAFLRENAGALKTLDCESLTKPFDIDAFLERVRSLLSVPNRTQAA